MKNDGRHNHRQNDGGRRVESHDRQLLPTLISQQQHLPDRCKGDAEQGHGNQGPHQGKPGHRKADQDEGLGAADRNVKIRNDHAIHQISQAHQHLQRNNRSRAGMGSVQDAAHQRDQQQCRDGSDRMQQKKRVRPGLRLRLCRGKPVIPVPERQANFQRRKSPESEQYSPHGLHRGLILHRSVVDPEREHACHHR